MNARVVIGAPNSNSGKTTVSIGLMAALTARGMRVAPFKVGPDYIDPGYHSLATGRVGRNLDAWLCGQEMIAPLFAHGSRDADISVVEGVMGLYDGRLGLTEGRHGFGSTAHIAELIDAPVVLVAEPKGVSRTLAASCLGLVALPGAPRIAGIILNKAGSPRAVAELRQAFEEVGLPVLGAIPRSQELVVPSRHLGLVPAAERDQARAVVDAAGALVAQHVDLDALLAIAETSVDERRLSSQQSADGERRLSSPRSGRIETTFPAATGVTGFDTGLRPYSTDVTPRTPGPSSTEVTWPPVMGQVAGRPRIAVAAGRAFTFRYAETTELLEFAGCEIVEFDPLVESSLPAGTSGLYLGGGFPEVYAEDLAANQPLLAEVRSAIAAGLPTVAECAGLLYLCRTLDGLDMANVISFDAQMSARLTLGYRDLIARSDSVIARVGESYRSHEFHRTIVRPAKTPEDEPGLTAAWSLGDEAGCEGVAGPNLLASYQHLHWAGYPHLAQRLAQAAADFAASGPRWSVPVGVAPTPVPDLRHHGDAQAEPGLEDLAVNVRPAPQWLLERITAAPMTWQAYPDATAARQALANHHGLPVEQVLTTAGAADGFTLIARTFAHRKVVVVHPQFTEPEVAWRSAGHQVRRVLLRADEGFQLNPGRISDDIDLVVIGNPTNPTGVLHRRAEIQRLVRPGRIVVVDEAFMDFVPGELDSFLHSPGKDGCDLAGILVTRSLTKLWGIAGLRAGFVAGDPSLLAQLSDQQEPWATSTPALDAIVAICTPRASAEQERVQSQVAAERAYLVAQLQSAGFEVAGDPQTPFVLVNTAVLGPHSAHAALAEQGYAVRRCDTFPGLGPTWLRVAVRERETTDGLLAALARLIEAPVSH